MNIFIICSIRGASAEIVSEQETYVGLLEQQGHSVYFPPRDTDQSASGLDICSQNYAGISWCDEAHVFYWPDSQGTHFDMGMAFALNKRVKPVRVPVLGPGKSFARMLTEWAERKSA